MQYPNKIVTMFCTLLTSTALATETPCDYTTKTKVVYEGSIESVRVVKKNVQKYVEDTRKCSMSIEALIKGKWHPSTANYIFGPDMSELDACSLAENRAKTKVMRTIIPETLKSEKNLKCDLTSPKKSCRVVLIDAEVSGFGKQKVRMLSCD
jgi:hypothetical protein|tara:strand:- start:1465 stop:1920 length:456 start_codon:yes stop_codon:yes gene_type:complete